MKNGPNGERQNTSRNTPKWEKERGARLGLYFHPSGAVCLQVCLRWYTVTIGEKKFTAAHSSGNFPLVPFFGFPVLILGDFSLAKRLVLNLPGGKKCQHWLWPSIINHGFARFEFSTGQHWSTGRQCWMLQFEAPIPSRLHCPIRGGLCDAVLCVDHSFLPRFGRHRHLLYHNCNSNLCSSSGLSVQSVECPLSLFSCIQQGQYCRLLLVMILNFDLQI